MAGHGHLVDAGELDRMDELFTADVIYDLTDLGFGELRGVPALREAALALGDANPVGHHVTNVLITENDAGTVVVRSKGIGIDADGGCGSVTYEDVVVPGIRWMADLLPQGRAAPSSIGRLIGGLPTSNRNDLVVA
ncbi:nuclear transport factor 2 family protein [Nocardia sp. NPDC057455]|uniref:nuclear transport factor 2 family protein n=1 Tax=Nocardia sp. NPDC057455 TaxID=3346138 RepID=UPI00366DBC14